MRLYHPKDVETHNGLVLFLAFQLSTAQNSRPFQVEMSEGTVTLIQNLSAFFDCRLL